MYNLSRTVTATFPKPFTRPDPVPIHVHITEEDQERWSRGEATAADFDLLALLPEIIVRNTIALGQQAQQTFSVLQRIHEAIAIEQDPVGASGIALGASEQIVKAYDAQVTLAALAKKAIDQEKIEAGQIPSEAAAGGPLKLILP